MRFAVLCLFSICFVIVLLPELMPLDPIQTNSDVSLVAPSGDYWFGTDLLGRDLFSRVIYGGRRTLGIALSATLLAILLGGVFGLLMGYYREADWIFFPIFNALLAIPTLLIAMVILSVFGNNFWQLTLALGISQVANYTFVIRNATRALSINLFIQSANALGATRFHILRRHILPNIRNISLSYAGVLFSYSILNESTLSFLGLGGEPGVPDWGIILNEGRIVLGTSPWVSLIPGILIAVTVYCVNTIVDKIA